MTYGAKTYKNTQIKTATPEQVLLLLYEGAIKAAKLARQHMQSKNVAEKCKQITKVHDIVAELHATLDARQNPEIAAQLGSLYDFMASQLLKANMNNDLGALDNVISVLSTLHEGWVVAVEEVNRNKASERGGR